MQLRPYQVKCVEGVQSAKSRGLSRVLYVLPTGCGKTAVFCELVDRLHQPGRPALVIAHREELLGQAWERICHTSPHFNVGMERGAETSPHTVDVVIASVQTIGRKDSNRLQWLADAGPSVIICDEAHHVAADGYQRVFERFGAYDKRSFLVGCTATPKRMDKRALHGHHGATFEELVYQYSIRDAIADKFLCQIRGYRVKSDLDMSSVRTTAADFNSKDLAKVVNVAARTDRAIEHWQAVAGDRRTIVFCVDVEHAQDCAKAFRDKGIAADCVHGGMSATERRAALARHKAGQTQVLTNCEILTEGYDDPIVSSIIMLRPTQSWSLYVQMVGRGTRIAPGKEDVVVIDIVDNSAKHSLATVPAILDLPPGIDLQGHTLEEAAKIVDDLGAKAARLKPDSCLSFSDLCTKMEEVDLLAAIETPEHIAAISALNWLEVPGGYYLHAGNKRSAHLSEDALGNWSLKMVDGDRTPKAQNFANEITQAFRATDEMLLKRWPESQLIMVRGKKWQSNLASEKQVSLLMRFGLPEPFSKQLTKGQAGRLITQKIEEKKSKKPALAATGTED